MSAERKVLLARPNDFLVEAMRAAAREAGFAPVPLSALRELASVPVEELAGAIVSTAVTSAVSESVEQVVAAVRARAPRLPLAVVTMLADVRAAEGLLDAALTRSFEVCSLTSPVDLQTLGRPEVLLLLRKQDLEGAALARTVRALRSHFE